MKAMILAAGRGERMGELVSHTPKILLDVGGKALIEHHLQALFDANITEVIINVHYLADRIQQRLRDGSCYGLSITYSVEDELLGMGGGIYKALPLLGEQPFIVISGDMWTDYRYIDLPQKIDGLAHLAMVDNPDFHPQGDFQLKNGKILPSGEDNLNYAGFGVFSPDFFNTIGPGAYGIGKPLLPAIDQGLVTGEYYQGRWMNINTAEQLNKLRKHYEAR